MIKVFKLARCYTIRFLLVFIVLFSQQLFAETINLVAEVFPPQTNRDGTGQQFDVARAIFEPLGYTVKVEVYPYRRVIHLLENKQADIAIGIAGGDNKKILFSQQPHDSDNLVAIYPNKNKINWQGGSTLSGKRLLFIAGLTEGLSLGLDLSAHEISEVNTREQAFKKLLMGRDDFLIDCECGFLLDEVSSYRSQFSLKRIGFLKIYAAFANNEKGLKLKEIWQRDFPSFIKTDAAREIYQKWGLMREYAIIRKVLTQKH